ncbi:DUF2806 domain-containing protein [Fulvimarina endophytica]|uniref:DUF2806 domain-containing protein n=1 Tax=Fulvimarina endophytica TaxID=2293836 RepID=A0A371XB76_9HYPH|nr:DUF2806 domain-containing protein [Fulvimarina endophytica]RFC66495.1 DUF2806 domain-containing protein [Fulvimarina endophytica]
MLTDPRNQPRSDAEGYHCPNCGGAWHDGSELCVDWMNRFARYAEDASTDHRQTRWGKVMAHEIRNPGSLTFADLREIDEALTEEAWMAVLSRSLGRTKPTQTRPEDREGGKRDG